jgi:NADPH-dependent curcumin reductase CurA
MITKQIVLASRPKGLPTLGNFKFENVELPAIKPGEVLLKGLYYSVNSKPVISYPGIFHGANSSLQQMKT